MSLNRFFWFGLFALITISAGLQAQIQGRIVEYSQNHPLPYVRITVVESGETVTSDAHGYFILQSEISRETTLKIEEEGFYTLIMSDIPAKVNPDGELIVQMVPGNSQKILYYLINTIEVTADKSLKNPTMETRYIIDQGDIKHFQASNLGDLLEFVPGYIRRNRPGLKDPLRANLRGIFGLSTAEITELYGMGIYFDGVSIDNLMNGTSGEFISTPHVSYDGNNGVDLRKIPVDGLQSVEIVPGLSSVEYGNLISGMVLLKSRFDRIKPEIKIKTNPDTRELSYKTSLSCFPAPTNFFVDVASSDRDLRAKTDSWNRFHLQFNGKIGKENSRFEHKWKFGFTSVSDKYRNPVFKSENYYHKTQRFSSSVSGKYRAGQAFFIAYQSDFSYDYRNTHEYSPNTISSRIISTRTSPGTQMADTLSGSYMALADVISKEYTGRFKLNAHYRLSHSFTQNYLMAGLEYRSGKNKGNGASFNPLTPPQGLEGARPYRFSSRPGYQILSIWFQDEIQNQKGIPIKLRLGARSDLYQFGSAHIRQLRVTKSRFYLSPRLGILATPKKGIQLRATVGQTTKSPSMNIIYQKPIYIDTREQGVMNTTSGPIPVDLITTSVVDYANFNMKPIQQTVYETGIDLEPHPKIGINLTAFYRYTDQIPVAVHLPFFRETREWLDWGNSDLNNLLSSGWEYVGNNLHWESRGWSLRRGMEFSIRSHRFSGINSRFSVGGAYVFSREGEDQTRDLENSEIAEFASDTLEVLPYYKTFTQWKKQFNLSATWDYLNKKWKLWVSATIYWQPFFKFRNIATSDSVSYAAGYFTNGVYSELSRDEAVNAKLYRSISTSSKSVQRVPEMVYFNFNITKSVWRDLAVSFYINNIFNNRYYYYNADGIYQAAAPEVFYGMQFTWNIPLAGGK